MERDVSFVHVGAKLVLLRVRLPRGSPAAVKITRESVAVVADKELVIPLPGPCNPDESHYEVDEVAQLLTVSLVPETTAEQWRFPVAEQGGSVAHVSSQLDAAEQVLVRTWSQVVAVAQRYWLSSPHWLSLLYGAVYLVAAYGLHAILWGDRHFSGALFLFQKTFGALFLLAWVSAAFQIRGLCGPGGIVPCEHEAHASHFSLLSSRPTDAELLRVCFAGMAACAAFTLNLFPSAAMAASTLLYLSIRNAGTVFFRLQFDSLLIEAGWIAVLTFLAPLRWIGFDFGAEGALCPRLGLFLLQWLMLRVLFSSGVVKLTSRDETWAACAALEYHWLTQPLPLRAGMLMQRQLPRAVNRLLCWGHFVLELAVPLAFFVPRLRALAVVASVALQGMIGLTGHYGFFNLLSAALTLAALDDSWLPAGLVAAVATARNGGGPDALLRLAGSLWNPAAAAAAAAYTAVILACSLVPLGKTGKSCGALTGPLAALAAAVEPLYRPHLARLGCLSPYGLFAVMTTRRQEVIIEGSDDGRDWRPYELAYKPGCPALPPPWSIPPGHLPRLQWWLWFCPFGEPEPWVLALQQRLLEGAPAVLALFDVVPFDRPRYVRMDLYNYRFATAEESRRTGHFWVRRKAGPYVSAKAL